MTRQTLDAELNRLRDDLLKMGDLVENALVEAIACLEHGDPVRAQALVESDRRANALRFHIEEECVALIATQQPAASDLRRALTGITMAGDLERMGDYAAGIGKAVLRMQDEHRLPPGEKLLQMAAICREMVHDSLEAFRTQDAERARQIAARDDALDDLYRVLVAEILAAMVEHPRQITTGTYLLWCAHNIERMGDRATNISERVIFMTTGALDELNQGRDLHDAPP